MAGNKVIYLTGKASWCKLIEPDEYMGVKNWKFDFYPDDKSWDIIKANKIQKKIRESEDGKFISLARPVLKKWKLKDGENPNFDPPRLLDKDDNPFDTSKLIGNGSSVTVKVEVYQTSKGAGTRFDVVRIDDLIEYEGASDQMPKRETAAPAASGDQIPF